MLTSNGLAWKRASPERSGGSVQGVENTKRKGEHTKNGLLNNLNRPAGEQVRREGMLSCLEKNIISGHTPANQMRRSSAQVLPSPGL